MDMYFVRHGHTDYNLKNLCNDDPTKNVCLTSLGIKQAEEVAGKLKNTKFEIIVVSQLLRTKETAEIINKYHGVPIIVDKRINDRKTGFEGKTVAEFHHAIAQDKFHMKINDGESFYEEQERIIDFLKDCIRNLKYTSILVVTHSEIMKIIYGYFHLLTNEEIWTTEIDNCQVIKILQK